MGGTGNTDGNEDGSGELLALLAAYEQAVRGLHAGWDSEAFSLASRQFGLLRDLCMRLPAIHVEWVEVLISRFEFTDVLWQQHGRQGGARLHEVHERHAAALLRLRLACGDFEGSRRAN